MLKKKSRKKIVKGKVAKKAEPVKRRASTRSRNEHYVNNELLLETLVNYRKEVVRAKKVGEDVPQIPEFVGESLLKIATHLSNKYNFSGYIFREEMISDGIENCLLYLHNFDPKKSKNPFSYFTQITYFAFLRRIKREKQELYTKCLSIRDQNLANSKAMTDYDRQVEEFIADYENPERKNAPKKTGRQKKAVAVTPKLCLEDED